MVIQFSLRMTKKQILLLSTWGTAIIAMVVYLSLHPEMLEPANIKVFLESFNSQLWVLFIIANIVRGFFLFPNTPLLLAGAFLFPHQLWLVFWVSMAGVMLTAVMMYHFAELIGIGPFLERKHPKQIFKWEERLQRPQAIFIVMFWVMLPFTPTDLVYYVAGSIRMKLRHLLIGVFVGEVILKGSYLLFLGNLE